MSKKNLIFLVLGLAVVAAAAVLLTRPTMDKIDINRGAPLEPTSSVPQVITKIFPREDTARYSVNAEYPELQGVSAPGVQEKINGRIKSQVYNEIAAFHSSASNPSSGVQDVKSTFDGKFDVKLLTKSFFSVLLSYSDFSAGAAHPESYSVALNYSLKTGDAVTLDQFLKTLAPSAGYMDRLIDLVEEDLTRRLGNNDGSLGALDLGTGYANYTLDKTGMSIYFDPGQVAPYAAGASVVTIAYDDLMSDVVKPAGAEASASSSVEWWLE